MWTTIYVASGSDWAKTIEKKLFKEGYIVKIKFFALEGDEELFEIMAPSFEAEEIQNVLMDLDII